MNESERDDARLLKQVDDRLERGAPVNNPVIMALAETVPTADDTFRDALEQRLLTHVNAKTGSQQESNMQLVMSKETHRTPVRSYLTWIAAMLVVTVLGSAVLRFGGWGNSGVPGAALQTTEEAAAQTIVIALADIGPSETITEEMVGTVTLSADDLARLQVDRPNRAFFSSLDDVVGQVTTSAISWFEPIDPVKLGQVAEPCVTGEGICVAVPDGLYTIYLPLPMISLETQGIIPGDRVDVLASADNQLRVIAEDVVLTGVEGNRVLLAASSWKQAMLIWLDQSAQPYTLRLTDLSAAPAPRDETRVEYEFTAPEALPEDYTFDLVVEVLVSQSYWLADAPYSLDETQYTQRDVTMNFWYTDLEVVSITDGTNVVISLPRADAENLDFMLQHGADLTFLPDAQAPAP